MESCQQEQTELRFKDIFKSIKKHIKTLIIALLISIIAGISFSAIIMACNKKYGTQVDFYITPITAEDELKTNFEPGVYGTYNAKYMDNIIKLLKSASFAERLYLEDNLMPSKNLSPEIKDAVEKAENMLLENGAVDQATKAVEEAKKTLEEKTKAFTQAKNNYTEARDDYSIIINSPNASTELINSALTAKNTAETARDTAEEELETAKLNVELALEGLNKANAEYNTKRNDALNLWSETNEYKRNIKRTMESVKWSYYTDEEEKTTNFATAFIYVSISVENDEAFAKDLLDRIGKILPKYVEQTMGVPDGYTSTSCTKITRMDAIKDLQQDEKITTPLKYGGLAGIITVGILVAYFIFVDTNKKSSSQTAEKEFIEKGEKE